MLPNHRLQILYLSPMIVQGKNLESIGDEAFYKRATRMPKLLLLIEIF